MIPELPLEQELQKEKISIAMQNCMIQQDANSLHEIAKGVLELLYMEKRKSLYFMQEAARNLSS